MTEVQEKKNGVEMRTNLKRPPTLLFSNRLRSLNGCKQNISVHHKRCFLRGMRDVGHVSPHGRLGALTETSLCCHSVSALRRESG